MNACRTKWIKKGLIYKPEGNLEFSQSHAQVPVPMITPDRQCVRVFFSTRDSQGRSRITYLDLDRHDLSRILKVSDKPILDLGTPGTFDDMGVMPSWSVRYENKIYLYYIGWNVRNTVPYHNSVGLAVSHDGGESFSRVCRGPLIDRTPTEPFFAGSSCVLIENGVWKNWYLSCTEWREVDERMEPRYHIKYAESKDGINWTREGKIAIDYKSDNEAGIVKASVVRLGDEYRMWYSYRDFNEYRTNTKSSYKIGYATSADGLDWCRRDDEVGISLSRSGWDSMMMAYPHVIKEGNKLVMLYNGNGFGEAGFGFAELEL